MAKQDKAMVAVADETQVVEDALSDSQVDENGRSTDVQIDEAEYEVPQEPQPVVEETPTMRLAKIVIGTIYGEDATTELANLMDSMVEASLDAKLDAFFGSVRQDSKPRNTFGQPKNEVRHAIAATFTGSTVKELLAHFKANGEDMSYQVARYYFLNVLKLG